jgi:hypothetical protein
MAHKLDIFKVLRAIDSKDYDFYDNMSDEEKKGFSAFLGLKWGAGVESDVLTQCLYVIGMNNRANRHMFDINRDPKLQWLTLVAGSPKLGNQRHVWASTKNKAITSSVKTRQSKLTKLFPHYKDDEIELLSNLVTTRQITEYAKDCGEK